MNETDTIHIYRPVSFPVLLKKASGRQKTTIFAAWLVSLLLSIGLGLASIIFEWSGIQATFGGISVHMTLYPPLIISLFWTLWFGFWWGFIPAYLSTLVLALFSGMPVEWALLFAFADPIGLAVFAIAYQALPVSIAMRSLNALLIFIALSFVSGIFGSSGSFIWTYTNNIGVSEMLPIWQGWWLGAFLQNILIVAPLLALFSPTVINWRNNNNWIRQNNIYLHKRIILMTTTMLVGVFIYIYVSIRFSTYQFINTFSDNAVNDWQVPVKHLTESVSALFWVVSTIIIFITLFGYRLFTFWSTSLKQSQQALQAANNELEERVQQRTHELEEAKENAERANAAKSKFLTNTSHELRTPLNAILGFGQLLEIDTNPALNSKHREYAHDIVNAGEHLLDIVNQLLDLSHIESGRAKVVLQKIDFVDILRQCISFIRPLANKQSVTIIGGKSPENVYMVTADPSRLKQVIINLLSNAVKYNQRQGYISILVNRHEDFVQLVISNTGAGISAGNLEHIFDLFNRAEAHTQIEGTGIGLAVSRNLVDLMHGKITVQSTLNDLTIFTLSLPAA